MKRLYEKKDHLINRNRNLTSERKSEIIELLGRHPSYENKIDWNKGNSLTYEDFLKVLRPLYINELDPRGLVEGEDYDLIINEKDEQLYIIYTYEASKILASNSVEPELWTKIPSWCGEEEFTDEAHAFGHFDPEHGDLKPGAKWCISMQTSDNYWKQYSKNFCFFFWFRNNSFLKNNIKIAIGVYKSTWQIGAVYNGADNEIGNLLPSYITEAINGEKDNYKEKELHRIKSMFTFNPQTNRYDYEGSLDRSLLRNLISEDGDGFIIDFGEITGDFNCSGFKLKSLKGAPQKVGRHFDCSDNQLTSLIGSPQKVGGYFLCHKNQLISLKGVPKEIGEDFWCFNNQLTSLKGAPKEVGGSFDCSDNQLTSLEGAPQEIKGIFDCSNNSLTSLEGAPQKVGGHFDCSWAKLTSLEGAPQTVGWGFYCYDNHQLTALKGAPKKVGRDFNCSWAKLTSLIGAPQEVGKDFFCYNNSLTSLIGAPQKVGGDFNCINNPNLHSLEGIGEIKGHIYKDF